MLDAIIGSRTRRRVLQYLAEHSEGYARGMSTELGCALDTVQKQLGRLAQGGVVRSRRIGRTLVYVLDPDYPLRIELQDLLRAARLLARSSDASPEQLEGVRARTRYIVRRIE